MNTNREQGDRERPYRSHVYPACLPCKKRKSRCKTKDAANECMMCQAHGTDCVFPGIYDKVSHKPRVQSRPTVDRRGRARKVNSRTAHVHRLGHSVPQCHMDDGNHGSSQDMTITGMADTGDTSSHVVSPAVVDDNNVLERYLSATPQASSRYLVRTHSNPKRLIRPVLFNAVPRRPLGVPAHQSLAEMKCELIEKYIEPDMSSLLDMFFVTTNWCFPAFDEASFENMLSAEKGKISSALLCNLYASSLIYHPNTPDTSRPLDSRYVWNQANEALHSELFLSPGISTVVSIILNVGGRPSTAIFGNGGMLGAAVSFSHALGLNRNPSNWDISTLEKRFRMRIWWLVVIHDRWYLIPCTPSTNWQQFTTDNNRCSLAYGTPPQIHHAHHDVPILAIDDLCPPNAPEDQKTAASIFIALTTLTQVLGCYLEHIYTVSSPSTSSSIDLEQKLLNWEETLPDDIRHLVLRGDTLSAPGAANFRLAYLAVKLLLRRIQLDSNTAINADTNTDHNTIHAQRAAEDIVHLVQALTPYLHAFWMPVLAYTLTSATTLLLRLAIGQRLNSHSPRTSPQARNKPLRLARDMVTALESHRQFGWDLADHCLGCCGGLVGRIEALQPEDDLSATVLPDVLDVQEMGEEGEWFDPYVLEDLFSGVQGEEGMQFFY